MKHKKKIAVVGCGIAGMATAIRLSAVGHQVTVFEKNDYPGGKLTEIKIGGYRFDAGPSLFTMPWLLLDLLKISGIQSNTIFPMEKLEKLCHYFWEDGTVLKADADRFKFASEVEKIIGEPKDNIIRFLQKSEKLYQITAPIFLERSLHLVSTYTRLQTVASFFQLPTLGVFDTMNNRSEKRFKKAKTIQLFNRYATYNGSNPYVAPATLHVIPHLEFNTGAFFPKNGMQQITNTLYQVAVQKGVTIHLKTPITEILHQSNKITGVRTDNMQFDCDIVVCNADAYAAYDKILPHTYPPKRLKKAEPSSSALIFYWGIQKQFPELDLHNILFSDDYQNEFKCIFQRKELCSDPTVYINISSKYNAKDAPEGCENWFVMVNAPADYGQNWELLKNEARKYIVAKINRILHTNIEDYIVCENTLTPDLIQKKTGSFRGSLYGSSSNTRLSAFFRHSNFSSSIKGLYFAGGSVHPGGGIPLCLMGAKIVSDLIENET